MFRVFLSKFRTFLKLSHTGGKEQNLSWNVDDDSPVDCHPGVSCTYPDVVDLRIIVITFNRSESLRQLLESLEDVEMDGDTAALEIWIDRSSTTGEVDARTVDRARRFRWRRGRKRVHIQRRHVGICGQWIDTWRPPASRDDREMALILKDDLSISPYVYRWWKAAMNRFYGDDRLAGFHHDVERLAAGGDARRPRDSLHPTSRRRTGLSVSPHRHFGLRTASGRLGALTGLVSSYRRRRNSGVSTVRQRNDHERLVPDVRTRRPEGHDVGDVVNLLL